eukprot:1740904-Prymnesium_polylepis.1
MPCASHRVRESSRAPHIRIAKRVCGALEDPVCAIQCTVTCAPQRASCESPWRARQHTTSKVPREKGVSAHLCTCACACSGGTSSGGGRGRKSTDKGGQKALEEAA